MSRGVPWELKPKKQQQSITHEIDPETRAVVARRADGRDEVTGERFTSPPDLHHRQLTSRGGKDDVFNLVACSRFTHRQLHKRVRWATEQGWIVSAYADPKDVAVLLHGTAYVLLDNNGGYIDAEHGPGDAA